MHTLTALHSRYQRVAVVPYALTIVTLNGAVGLLRLLESPNRTASPAYHAAASLPFPIRDWGWLFLAVAVLTAVSNGRQWALYAACVIGSAGWAFWAALLAAAAFETGRSSYVGVILYGAAAARHLQVVAAPDLVRRTGRRLWRGLRPCST